MFATRKTVLTIVLGTLAPFAGFGFAVAQEDGSRAMLEEITVTAQRREQSLQEVPISIETITGLQIQQQGYRDLNELANFSATVYIDDDSYLSQDRSIRGFGTSGNALTLEQAVPIFVDGIHFGRPAQVRLAFMDPERVEVLKGPQPVFFGMNAIAGAFNITSAGPTPEWEGYLDAEVASFATTVVNGAVGGPLSETLGIRVAGKYEDAGGYIDDVVNGGKIGAYENFGGRVILEFTPNDRLQVTGKVEYSEIDKDPEATVMCLTDGSLLYARNRDGNTIEEGAEYAANGGQGNERSIWAPPLQGAGWSQNYKPLKTNCEQDLGDAGVSNGGPFFAPPENIREENSNFGAMDTRAAVDQLVRLVGVTNGLKDTGEQIESTNGYVNFDYEMNDNLTLSWLTGYSELNRAASRDNSNTPFLLNYQNRGEDYRQWSSELRLTSGPGTIEWMAGYAWQRSDMEFINNSPRPNVRRGWRYNDGYEDTEWNTAFATITLNFMNDKMSLDLGGRWTDIDKVGGIKGRAGQANDALFLLPGANFQNLWVIPYRESRNTPLSWIGSRAAAVGLQEVDYDEEEGNGPYGPGMGGDFDISEFDPQVTLRYRPSDNHSLFLRYAESFKAGGFDTGVTSINSPCTSAFCETPYDNFSFAPEYATTIEAGSKGTFGDGRFRYDVTFFETTFEDLQITVSTGIPDDPFLNVNAGEQRVRGMEFGLTMAATDNLTLDFGGALLDGEFTDFGLAGCTEVELRDADTGPCISAEESIELVGDDGLEGRIDRTGSPTPKTPDWKFLLGMDYDVPLSNDYVVNLNAKGYVSDGFITDVNGFSEVVSMKQHEDLSITLSFGPQDGNWRVSAFGRNLLEAKLSYDAELDIVDNGIAGDEGGDGGVQMSRSNFRTYGVKFRYSF
jgi:outer membrane receptor protein involved in Fe transport